MKKYIENKVGTGYIEVSGKEISFCDIVPEGGVVVKTINIFGEPVRHLCGAQKTALFAGDVYETVCPLDKRAKITCQMVLYLCNRCDDLWWEEARVLSREELSKMADKLAIWKEHNRGRDAAGASPSELEKEGVGIGF